MIDWLRERGFPIPMRGNELVAGAILDRLRVEFPIPMRGNEGFQDVRQMRADLAFPIPMRGNEHRAGRPR